jgi:peroxiredoxin Q/BCP
MLHNKAPEFHLTSTTGQQVHLADLLGSYVVLVFYPANDTPVCNRQLSEVNVDLDKFLENNVRVFGVNTSSVAAAKGYCERKRLQFPILSDPGGKVARDYHAAYPVLPVIRRTVVAIDPLGEICFFQHGKPEPDVVLEAIRSHQGRSGAVV